MLSETLDKLDEKFLTNPRSRMSYLSGDEKRELVKFVEEEIKLSQEEVISYISQQQGWEESEDIYRTRFGFLPKYIK